MQKKISIMILMGWLLVGCSAVQIDFESGPSIFQVDLNLAEEPTGIPTAPTSLPVLPTASATRTRTPLPTPAPELPTEEPAPAKIVTIAAGGAHACALFQDGAVWCWGKNESGQLGNGSTINSLGPVQVQGLAGKATALVAGWAHTCMLSQQGAVECWGYNKFGELGNGSTINSAHPVAVKGLSADVQSIAAGDDHTCAVLNDGSLRCWGFNENGQLGDRTSLNSIVPVAVPGMAHPITAVTAGGGHTCALSDQRGILCWGDNTSGQLGDDKMDPKRTYAAIVPGLENNVTAIAARSGHTCALLSTGGVQCWGDNQNGELGDGTLETRRTPVPVMELRSGVIGLAAGGTHTCAVVRGGGVMCWGRNYHGQLGNGSKLSSLVPASVTSLEQPVSDLALGPEFSCALLANGRITCWGKNSNGELGDGTQTDSLLPLAADIFSLAGSEAMLPTGMTMPVASGNNHTCAITKNGGVQCWGSNKSGQLGDGSFKDSALPVHVVGLQSGVVALAAGGDHTCALLLSGAVKCWGSNVHDELGDVSFANQPAPVFVRGLEEGGAGAVAAGEAHTCVLLTDGDAACWGSNDDGQSGMPLGTSRMIPNRVAGIPEKLRTIASSARHTCAVTVSGIVYCWGLNHHGQLGTGDAETHAEPVPAGNSAFRYATIAAGGAHTCALDAFGLLACWGWNADGQLGSLEKVDQYLQADSGLSPVYFREGGKIPIAVTTGERHACTIVKPGAAWCWGYGGNGELGNGNTWSMSQPTSVKGLESGVLFISAGDRHTCALLEGWTVMCWGANWAGQLGNREETSSSIPVAVMGFGS